MSVKIDVELTAGDAEGEILGIAGALRTLQRAGGNLGDIDLDFDDWNVDEISEMAGELEDVAEQLDGLFSDFDGTDKDRLGLQAEIDAVEKRLNNLDSEIDFGRGKGETGGGGSSGNDPPSGSRKSSSGFADKLERTLESAYGLDRGSVTVANDLDSKKLNDLSDGLRKAVDSDKPGSNLGVKSLPGNLKDSISVTTDRGKVPWRSFRKTQSFVPDNIDFRAQDLEKAVSNSPFDSDIAFAKADRQAQRKQSLDGLHDQARMEKRLRDAQDRAKARRDLIEERAAARKRVQVSRDHEEALRKKKGRDFLKPSNIKKRLANLGDSSSGIARRLRKLVPSMGMIYNAVAAMLPALIALGVQLLGVASAMGAVAVAGGAIIGLGLLGHGDSMAESMRNAKLQMRELKNEMFAVAQPTMQEFAPIQEDIFEAIPGASEGIFEEMEGLTGFEGTLFDLGGMAAGGIEEFFAIINRNQGKISQLSKRFGGLAGSSLLSFFRFLINTGYKNQEMLVKLAATGKDLLTIIFNLSMIFGRVVSSLQPLFSVLSKLTVLLHSKLIVGLFSALAAMALFAVGFGKTAVAVWTLTSAVGSLLTFLGILSSGSLIGGMGAFFTTLSIYAEAAIAHLTALTGSALAAYAALSALTLGTFAVLGGIGLAAASGATSGMGEGGPSGGGGGGDTYVDDRSIEVHTDGSEDLASANALAEKIDRSTATERPNTGSNATDR